MMQEFLDNKIVFYVVIFICFINLIADISSHDFMFVLFFLVMVFSLDPFFENKTILLFLALITTNVFLLKFKYNRLKYYFLYLAKNNGDKTPSYVMEKFAEKKTS
jgi:hypothetical protein